MPVYDYKCHSCEHEFTEMKKISEYDLPCKEPCPECGKIDVHRHITEAPSHAKSGMTGKTHFRKPDDFNHLLTKMKKFYKGNKIDTN